MSGSKLKVILGVSALSLALGMAVLAVSFVSIGLSTIRLAAMPGPMAEIVTHSPAHLGIPASNI